MEHAVPAPSQLAAQLSRKREPGEVVDERCAEATR